VLIANLAAGQWDGRGDWVAGEAAAAVAEAGAAPRRHLEDTAGAVADVVGFEHEKNLKKLTDKLPTKIVHPFKSAASGSSNTGGHGAELSFQIPTLLPPGHFSQRSTTHNLERSPIVRFATAVDTWLHDPSAPQLYIGVGATFVGVCMCGCGSMAWQYLFSFAVALATALFVSYQDETLKLAPGPIGNSVLILQVAIVMGVATFLGFDGSQMILGCAVGLLSAYFTDPLASSWEKEFPWISFAWFCAGAAFGGVIFTAFRPSSLATLAPLIGGFLVISGSGALCTWVGGKIILEENTTWIDAASALLGHTGGAGMVGQCMLALISAMVFNATGDTTKSVIPMAIGLGLGALGTSTGFGCSLFKNCAPWLEPARIWAWPLLGGLGWMGTTACSAVWQLSQLAEMEKKNPKKSKRKGEKDRSGTNSRAEETNPLLTQPQLQLPVTSTGSSHSSNTYNAGYNAGRFAGSGY